MSPRIRAKPREATIANLLRFIVFLCVRIVALA